MELTVTNRSRAYPGRSSGDSKVDEVQYVVLKVCYLCTSGSVVEYRLAKARVAGSNPVSCSQRDRKKSHPMDGSFFYVRALPGSNGSNVYAPLRSSQANVPRTFCDVSCSLLKSGNPLQLKASHFFVFFGMTTTDYTCGKSDRISFL